MFRPEEKGVGASIESKEIEWEKSRREGRQGNCSLQRKFKTVRFLFKPYQSLDLKDAYEVSGAGVHL